MMSQRKINFSLKRGLKFNELQLIKKKKFNELQIIL